MSCHNTGECKPVRRGTSNSNVRGSSLDRQRRRKYLIDTYRADESIYKVTMIPGTRDQIEKIEVIPCCRCYRCGDLLTEETVTVDRIKPGIDGGTYARHNIRPSCGDCATETGLALLLARRGR